MRIISFHHHHKQRVVAVVGVVVAVLGPVQCRTELGWLRYHSQRQLSSALDVNQQTQSFVTSTITAFHNLATFARLVDGTGLEAALYGASPSAAVVGETKEAKEVIDQISLHHQAQSAKLGQAHLPAHLLLIVALIC